MQTRVLARIAVCAVAGVAALTAMAASTSAAAGTGAPPTVASAAGRPSVLNGDPVQSADSLRLPDAARQELETAIAGQLKATPGARRISVIELAWTDNGVNVVLTLPIPGAAAPAAADCPFQWVCVYDNVNFGGARGAYFNCGTASTPSYFGVSSWHNNQTNDTESWLLSGSSVNLSSSRALSKISYVGAPTDNWAWYIHVC
jgi:hypothetical protein